MVRRTKTKLCCTLNPIRGCRDCDWIICGDCFANQSMILHTTSIDPMHGSEHEGRYSILGDMTREQILRSWR